MILKRTDGPACIRCGCMDSEVVAEPKIIEVKDREPWPLPGVAVCGHCSNQFSFSPDVNGAIKKVDGHKALILVEKTICPKCHADDVSVRSSPKAKKNGSKVRYRKCRTCGTTFKESGDRAA